MQSTFTEMKDLHQKSEEIDQLTDRSLIFLASLASSTHIVSIKLSQVKPSQAVFEAQAWSQEGLESRGLFVHTYFPSSVCCSPEQGSSALGSAKNAYLLLVHCSKKRI